MGKVGQGAFGTVYRALHFSSQRLYALKTIDKRHIEKVRHLINK